MKRKVFGIAKRDWMYLFLGIILIATISGMIAYQYLRKDPVTVTFKDAQGFVTKQVVFKHPKDTVGEVVQRATSQGENFECDLSFDQKINAINSLILVEKISGNINVDGIVIPYTTGAETVKEVLAENNIVTSPVDTVTPALNEELTNQNSEITIQRGSNLVETKTEVLPYELQVIENDNAAYNKQVVIQPGQNGMRTYTQESIYNDGELVDSYIINEERTEPVTEVIEIGTNVEVGKPEIEKGDIEAWRPYVVKALEKNGLSTEESMVNKVLRQINTESAGDQNAHQEITDMNSFIGQEARGLMQTIPSTFEYYHFEGFDDILNGYHNLLAALNYAKERYGPNLTSLGEGHGY